MGSLGTTSVMSLLLAVAAITGSCGFLAANMVRRKRRPVRRAFLAGVFCGLLAGELYRVRRHGPKALLATALRALRSDLRTHLAAVGRTAGLLTQSPAKTRQRRMKRLSAR